MHTNQYLQWHSHHHLAAKYRVISTLPTWIGLFALNQNSLTDKYKTSESPLPNVSTLSGP